MTPNRAKELLEVITAYANGETIQCRHMGLNPEANWHDVVVGIWQDYVQYRIKPKPQFRPWTYDEIPPRFIISEKGKPQGLYRVALVVIAIPSPVIPLSQPIVIVRPESSHKYITLDEALRDYIRIHEDGTESPCGVEIK